MTIRELAALARAKNPGKYDDWSDEELGTAHAKKYKIPITPEPKSASPFRSLLSGIAETALPSTTASDYIAGPAYAMRHPIDSAKMLFGAAQDASQDQFEKMFSAPSKFEAVGHGLAGALPFMGPAAAMAGENIGQMPVDPDAGMRGVGNVVGIFAPGKLLRRSPVKPSEAVGLPPGLPDPLSPKVLPNVPLLPSEATGSKSRAMIERALESSAAGSGPFQNVRSTQQTALTKLADAIVSRVAQPGSSMDPYLIGSNAKKALKTATKDVGDNLHRGYFKLNKAMEGALIDLTPLRAIARERLDDINANNILLPKPTEVASLEPFVSESKPKRAPKGSKILGPDGEPAFMQKFLENTDTSFRSLRQFRTALEKGDVPIHEDTAGKMLSASKNMLADAANLRGEHETMGRLDRKWAAYQRDFQDPAATIPKMRDTLPPENVHKQLIGASLDDIANIKKAMGPESFRDVKARVMQDVIEQSMTGELDHFPEGMRPVMRAIGQATGGSIPGLPMDHGVTKMSGRQMRSILENKSKFGSDRLNAIFEPKEVEAILHLTKTAEKVGANGGSLVGALLNGMMFTDAIGAGKSLLLGDLVGAKARAVSGLTTYAGVNLASRIAAGDISGPKVLSRVLTRTGGSKAMANYIDALAKKNAHLPPSVRFKIPSKGAQGKAYFWGRIVGRMATEEAQKMQDEGNQ